MAEEKVQLVSDTFKQRVRAAKEVDVTPSTYITAGLPEEFASIVQLRLDNSKNIKALEAENDILEAEVARMLESGNVPACYVDEVKVCFQFSSRSTIDGIALLEKGVPKAVVEAATKTTESFGLRFHEPRAKKAKK